MEEETEVCYFSSLPEGVIAHILSLTTPFDICRMSAVSRVFHSAARSDTVWNRFLPTNLNDLISQTKSHGFGFDPISSRKKNVFFSLCQRPLLIDNGNMFFVVNKRSGRKCIILGARSLTIVWGATSHHWTWEHHPKSRFSEVAVLQMVGWLEIRGSISCRILSPRTTYGVYFVFKMKKRVHEGFNDHPCEAMVGIVGTQTHPKSVCLDPFFHIRKPGWPRSTWFQPPPKNMSEFEQPTKRPDGWFEIELGEFRSGDGDDEIEMTLMDVNGIKNGLVVEGIVIRPKPSSVVVLERFENTNKFV